MTAKPFDSITPKDHYIPGSYLAWDSVGGDRKRNRWLALLALLLTFTLSYVMSSVEVPKPDRAAAEKVPERLAKLVMQKKLEPPPPPPPKEEVKEEKPEEPKPDEPKPEKPTEVQVTKAKEKARKAFAEAEAEISAMQDLASAFDMGDQQLTKGTGVVGPGGPGSVSRDMITSRAGKGSGGVTMGAASSGGGGYGVAGGGKLAAVAGTKVTSTITEGGTGVVRKNASGKLERTQEEIRRIMDRNNGALQAIYQRALRNNPTLKGAIVIRLVIAPDGSVSTADILSSELGDPETEKKLITRIRAINFGAIEGVLPWDDKYTLNFFPS
ncbi:MAG: AgmX/PglI C-terminal domain-containing protein [Pseudomonadota bacterium]